MTTAMKYNGKATNTYTNMKLANSSGGRLKIRAPQITSRIVVNTRHSSPSFKTSSRIFSRIGRLDVKDNEIDLSGHL